MPKFEGARKRDIKAELAAELSELEEKDKVRKVPDSVAAEPSLEDLSRDVEKKRKIRPILRVAPSPKLEAQQKEEAAEREEKTRGLREALHAEPVQTAETKKKHAERIAAATKAGMEAFARAKQQREDMGETPKVLGKAAEETFERARKQRENIERVKSVIGQEKAARLWDEVMPMLWERKEGATSKEDTDAQNIAAKRATDYVVRFADIESKHEKDMTSKEAKAAIKTLNAEYAKYGLLNSYDPVVGTGRGRSMGPSREAVPGAVGSATGFPEREISAPRSSRKKRYETVYQATPEASKRLREEPFLPLTRETKKEAAPTATIESKLETLEGKLEKKHGFDPSVHYFGLERLDEEAMRRMASDPDYKKWVEEMKAATKEVAVEEQSVIRRGGPRASILAEARAEAEAEGPGAEEKFFAEGERMSTEAIGLRKEILDEAKDLQKDVFALQGTKTALAFEIGRMEKRGRAHLDLDKRMKELTAEINSKITSYNALVSRVEEEEPKEKKEGFRKQGEERNELLKRDEALHANVAELMRKKRTPAIQNRLARLSEEIDQTEERLKELAKTFGKVALPKTPVMARIAGFFRGIFYRGAKSQGEAPEVTTTGELTGMDISKETMRDVPNAQDLYLIALHVSGGEERAANEFVENAAKYLRAAKGGIRPYMKPFEQLVKDLDVADEPAVKELIAQAENVAQSKLQKKQGRNK